MPADDRPVDPLEALAYADAARDSAEREWYEALEHALEQGVTQSEIARRLDISHQAVGSRVRTMRRRLAELRTERDERT